MSRKFVTNIDLNLNEIQNAKFQILATDPVSPVEGQFWYNSTSKVFKYRTDSATLVLGRLDQISAPTSDVSLNSHKLTSVANGTSSGDAVNLSQLQAAQTGLDVKQSCRVATQSNVTLSSPGASIDGVTLTSGDRVLVKAQTDAGDNGIYVFNGSSSPMTRATDADADVEVTAGLFTFVEEGTDADTGWVLVTNNPIVVGTTDLSFTKFTGSGSGGVQKYAESIGDGASTTITVNHNLGTSDIVAQLFDISSGMQVEASVEIVDTDNIHVGFSVAPTSDQYRVVVLG